MPKPFLAACAVFFLLACDPPSNSSGTLTVTGDKSWGGPLKGTGVKKVTGQTGYTCEAWLYDRVAGPWGDEHPGDTNASYVFGLQLGRASGITALPTGVQTQGDATQGTSTPWPSEVRAVFDRYEGFKHSDTGVYTTGGTVTISRFDSEKLVGTFTLTGFDQYCDPSTCTYAASGDFDVANVDCGP